MSVEPSAKRAKTHGAGKAGKAEADAEEGQARLLNYIDGGFVAPHSKEYLENTNPATAQIINKIARSNSVDVNTAVAAATKAFPAWANTSPKERSALLNRIADKIEADFARLAEIESTDMGKPVGLARAVDIPRAVENFRFFAGAILHEESDSHAMPDATNITTRSPVGVCGLITPWNLPLYLLTWKVAPALACGNCVVVKPSEVSPSTASELAKIMHEVGLPKGVFNLVHGTGPVAGQALVAHPDVRLISFTGGTATGKIVAATAGPLFKKISLELGGKNASVVFADCDFDKAVEFVTRAAFANQGQICLCGSRVLVERSIHDRFVKAMVETAGKIKPGDPSRAKFGCLSSLAHRDKVQSYVAIAKEEGGTIALGGTIPALPPPFDKGAFFSPTIITGLSAESRCATEEIFGPVVTIHPFDTEEEAIKMINCTRYGLAGSLWTQDLTRAMRVTKAWDTGMVWVNTWLHRDLRVPFGGVKDSGIGVEGGKHSLEFYSRTKNVCLFH